MTSDTLLAALIGRWRPLAATAAALWAGAALVILAVPASHRAQALVAPAETTGIAVSALLSPLPMMGPGLLDHRPAGNFAVYLGALRAREAAAALRRETGLVAALSEDRLGGLGGRLLGIVGLAPGPVTDDDLMRWLSRHSSATQSPTSIVWTLEVRHPDPALALAVLRTLHTAAEGRVREEMAEMVSRRLAWLAERGAREPDLTVRQALYELAAQAQRHAAVLASDTAVAARLVSAPSVEDRPSVPNRPLLLALAMPAALLAAAGLWAAILLGRAPPPPARRTLAPLAAFAESRAGAD